MIAKAILRYGKISAKKARLVMDVVRGKPVDEALAMLPNIKKKASELIEDVIASAFNNAKVKFADQNYTDDTLFISKITADEGPSLVRYRAASMGRASMIKRRTAHLIVELDVIPEKLEQIEKAKNKKKGAVQAKVSSRDKDKRKLAAAKGS